jgi:hypothetical protein
MLSNYCNGESFKRLVITEHVMKHECSLPHSQELAAGGSPESVESVLTLMPYVFEIQFNIVLPSTPECTKWPLFFRFTDKLLYSLSMSIVPVVCFAHIIHFYLNVIIFHGKYKL